MAAPDDTKKQCLKAASQMREYGAGVLSAADTWTMPELQPRFQACIDDLTYALENGTLEGKPLLKPLLEFCDALTSHESGTSRRLEKAQLQLGIPMSPVRDEDGPHNLALTCIGMLELLLQHLEIKPDHVHSFSPMPGRPDALFCVCGEFRKCPF